MTGGINWGEVTAVVSIVGHVYVALLLLFLFFTTFSVINIVTGVFVDGAIKMSDSDRSTLLEKEKAEKAQASCRFMELLMMMDTDDAGTLSYDRWQASLKNPDVLAYMRALGINVRESDALFDVLDRDSDGTIDVVEFVEGMFTFEGEAKNSDMQLLRLQVKKVLHMLDEVGAHFNIKHPSSREARRTVKICP